MFKNLFSYLIIPLNHPLEYGQFPERHRAAGMQTLGRNGHLGAQAQLAAIRKAGAGVYIHHRRVNLAGEAPRVFFIFGQNSIGMASGMGGNMLNGFVQRADRLDTQHQREPFGVEILMPGWLN